MSDLYNYRSLDESDPAELEDQGSFVVAAFLLAAAIIVLPAVAAFRAWDWMINRSEQR